MIRIEMEISHPQDDQDSVMAILGLITAGVKSRLENDGVVVHRITVEEIDA